MPTEIVTTDDLREFKTELLDEIKKILKEYNGQPSKKWLKSWEVRKLLNISPGTLQNLRINGTLPYTKIGGTMYYNCEDIQKMLRENQVCNRFDFPRSR
ncbi:helix-turn-helix domain-containing protein [Maribellus maritimus]|uniref:helix-turn-helix domain-containing protein n=1 Tax=Maribellus maritimus TaxID=2870838 RepID=UPI001EEB6DD3|nr:helix-turn-helix domain-containing protein [Maribellus maritimus]MCG6190842.1 helix-turn-helix domain-containing protein [Maribellus maritimus]